MTESIRERAQSFAELMSSLPPEEIARVNELNRKEAIEQHKQFSEAFKEGRCSFCGDALTAFDPGKPRRHWLLKPEGVGTEHIERIASQFSWGILENYLRWVANEEPFAKNINDLADEGTGTLLELTVEHKNLERCFRAAKATLPDTTAAASIRSGRKCGSWHEYQIGSKPFRCSWRRYLTSDAIRNAPDGRIDH